MNNFCTCTNHTCKLHPRNHSDGCTPCIRANLKTKDIPECFFLLAGSTEPREGDSFADFAGAVLRQGKP